MNLRLKSSYDGQAAMLFKHAAWLFLMGGMLMCAEIYCFIKLKIKNGGVKNEN